MNVYKHLFLLLPLPPSSPSSITFIKDRPLIRAFSISSPHHPSKKSFFVKYSYFLNSLGSLLKSIRDPLSKVSNPSSNTYRHTLRNLPSLPKHPLYILTLLLNDRDLSLFAAPYLPKLIKTMRCVGYNSSSKRRPRAVGQLELHNMHL